MQKVKATIALAPRSILLTLALIIILIVIRISLVTLALAFIAVILAAALEPVVEQMTKRRVPRVVAVLAVFFGFFILAGIALAVVIPIAVDQATGLMQNLPTYEAMGQKWIGDFQTLSARFHLGAGNTSLATRATSWFTAHVAAWLAMGVSYTRQAVEAVVDVVIIVLLTLFFLLDAPKLREGIIHLFPASYRPKVREQVPPLANALGNYVRGQLISMAALAAILAIGLWLVHEPYAWLIATISGVFEIVPWLGGAIGLVIATLVAVTVSWKVVLLVWVVFTIAHVIQGDILGPFIQSKVVEIHPAIILLSLIIGGELLGILGAIIAVPITAMLYVLATKVYVPLMDKQTGAVTIATPSELPPSPPTTP